MKREFGGMFVQQSRYPAEPEKKLSKPTWTPWWEIFSHQHYFENYLVQEHHFMKKLNKPVLIQSSVLSNELHVIDGNPQLIFVRASYTIETVEAEWISVDHVAHLKPSDGGSAATQLTAHLTGVHSAIKMLNSRIRVLHHYLRAMHKGDIPCENSLLRQISSLLRRLPAIESGKFRDDFLMEYNDTLLITYLAMLTNCSSTMNELIDKFNAAYDRHSRKGRRIAFK